MFAMIRRTLLVVGTLTWCMPTIAQVQRQFPPTALRGEIVFGQPPEVKLNSESWRLSPGTRIRGLNNMLVLSGSLVGSRHVVHYTVEAPGQIKDVWILRSDEIAIEPWPRTAKEAAEWTFDAIGQKWTRP
jgi:hypothetical protein